MLAVHGCLFQAVREDATDLATGFKRTAHRGLVNAFCPTRNDRPSRLRSQSTNIHRVVDQRIIDMTRSDHSEPTRLQ